MAEVRSVERAFVGVAAAVDFPVGLRESAAVATRGLAVPLLVGPGDGVGDPAFAQVGAEG